jgi:hypothetical protein
MSPPRPGHGEPPPIACITSPGGATITQLPGKATGATSGAAEVFAEARCVSCTSQQHGIPRPHYPSCFEFHIDRAPAHSRSRRVVVEEGIGCANTHQPGHRIICEEGIERVKDGAEVAMSASCAELANLHRFCRIGERQSRVVLTGASTVLMGSGSAVPGEMTCARDQCVQTRMRGPGENPAALGKNPGDTGTFPLPVADTSRHVIQAVAISGCWEIVG